MAFIILFSSITKVAYSLSAQKILENEAKEICYDYKVVNPSSIMPKQTKYITSYKPTGFTRIYDTWKDSDKGRMQIEVYYNGTGGYIIKSLNRSNYNNVKKIYIICPTKKKEITLEEEKPTIEPFDKPKF
jgi:hypothetical protein